MQKEKLLRGICNIYNKFEEEYSHRRFNEYKNMTSVKFCFVIEVESISLL